MPLKMVLLYNPTPPDRRQSGLRFIDNRCKTYLPVAVKGAGLSFGDGHAVQGNGEVGGVAIECPFERVELKVQLHPALGWHRPRALTPSGQRMTFGFDSDLNVAWVQALDDMVDWLMKDHGIGAEKSDIIVQHWRRPPHYTGGQSRLWGPLCVEWSG